jgi:MoaA/NifB/PqqE/SkfB family radical SAM enzyme
MSGTQPTMILKVHWEAWSKCNLRCQFCYRMKSVPMPTPIAMKMISKVAEAGVRDFVFAGGDPLVRNDIGALVDHAKRSGLRVELQTNCEIIPSDLDDWIKKVDLFGFSIDGYLPSTHDEMRLKKGNQARVIAFIELVEKHGIKFVVRSLVSKKNYSDVPKIGELLCKYSGLKRWSLLEFTKVGDGFRNADLFVLDSSVYASVIESIKHQYEGQLEIDAYFDSQKANVYYLIRSDGSVYTTGKIQDDGTYPVVGSLINDSFSEIADRLHIEQERHRRRYLDLM